MSIPDSCRAAAIIDGKPNHLEIIDVEIPGRLEPGSLLVETTAATVCATDVHVWSGSASVGGEATGPVILGHEATGRVARLGDGAVADSVGQPLGVGDRVIWSHGFCGQCFQCVVEQESTLCEHSRMYMTGSARAYPYLTGAFSEFNYVFPTSGRLRVPDDVSDEVASAASCALRTVIHGFDRLGEIREHQSIVVQGSGPLGLFAVARAALSGSSNVIVIGGPERRLQLASEWGAHHTIDIENVPDAAERRSTVMDLTNGRGADIVMEFSGIPAAFNEGMELVRSGGRYVVVGQTHPKEVPFKPLMLVARNLTLLGSRGASIGHYYRALEFIRTNARRFDWDAMISSRRPLAEINDSLAGMHSWGEIKPAITFA